MSRRDEFHQDLCDVLGSPHVYFQPPESIKLVYPCFVYEASRDDIKHADDKHYLTREGYDVTYISKDPDDDMKEQLDDRFTYCEWQRRFISDNLNHNIFKIYY